jgi:SAM-dependent methyltransferase
MEPTTTEYDDWFDHVRQGLESAYLATTEPWRQSGFSGPLERWNACRRPIADALDRDGTFLDIGCANGFLLESVVSWTAARGLRIEPFGLDFSEKLVALAAGRLPTLAERLFVGNAFVWTPPRRFDYVRTELCYVPEAIRWPYVRRLQKEFLTPGGRLLVAEYRSRQDSQAGPWVEDRLREAGLPVAKTTSGFWEGRELTRIAVVPAGGDD